MSENRDYISRTDELGNVHIAEALTVRLLTHAPLRKIQAFAVAVNVITVKQDLTHLKQLKLFKLW